MTTYYEVHDPDGNPAGVFYTENSRSVYVDLLGKATDAMVVIGVNHLWVETLDGRAVGYCDDPKLVREVMP